MRNTIAMTDPARPDVGVDLNREAHREYRERRNPVDVPLTGPIMSPEPMLPMWAIAVACGVIVFFGAQLLRGVM